MAKKIAQTAENFQLPLQNTWVRAQHCKFSPQRRPVLDLKASLKGFLEKKGGFATSDKNVYLIGLHMQSVVAVFIASVTRASPVLVGEKDFSVQ